MEGYLDISILTVVFAVILISGLTISISFNSSVFSLRDWTLSSDFSTTFGFF
jgi:hypothetical protein